MSLDLFQRSLSTLAQSPLVPWLATLAPQLEAWSQHQRHGELDKWLRILKQLPQLEAQQMILGDTVSLGPSAEPHQQAQIEGLLKQLMPWRKGPFNLFGVHIDTEWRSDWKWQRVLPHISSLADREVLDVGCGSGYHLWRMLEAGAQNVWGIDPGQLFMVQFMAIAQMMPANIRNKAHYFPVGIEAMPEKLSFDTVFSMGVLYHRRSPIDFLQQLRQQLRPGGELILETLVVDGDINTVLVPGERYAKMRNVWFLPSTDALQHWLQRVGFKDSHVVDVGQTQLDEQRRTEWMQGESLADFISVESDPTLPNKTIEGYPAPKRAVLVVHN